MPGMSETAKVVRRSVVPKEGILEILPSDSSRFVSRLSFCPFRSLTNLNRQTYLGGKDGASNELQRPKSTKITKTVVCENPRKRPNSARTSRGTSGNSPENWANTSLDFVRKSSGDSSTSTLPSFLVKPRGFAKRSESTPPELPPTSPDKSTFLTQNGTAESSMVDSPSSALDNLPPPLTDSPVTKDEEHLHAERVDLHLQEGNFSRLLSLLDSYDRTLEVEKANIEAEEVNLEEFYDDDSVDGEEEEANGEREGEREGDGKQNDGASAASVPVVASREAVENANEESFESLEDEDSPAAKLERPQALYEQVEGVRAAWESKKAELNAYLESIRNLTFSENGENLIDFPDNFQDVCELMEDDRSSFVHVPWEQYLSGDMVEPVSEENENFATAAEEGRTAEKSDSEDAILQAISEEERKLQAEMAKMRRLDLVLSKKTKALRAMERARSANEKSNRMESDNSEVGDTASPRHRDGDTISEAPSKRSQANLSSTSSVNSRSSTASVNFILRNKKQTDRNAVFFRMSEEDAARAEQILAVEEADPSPDASAVNLSSTTAASAEDVQTTVTSSGEWPLTGGAMFGLVDPGFAPSDYDSMRLLEIDRQLHVLDASRVGQSYFVDDSFSVISSIAPISARMSVYSGKETDVSAISSSSYLDFVRTQKEEQQSLRAINDKLDDIRMHEREPPSREQLEALLQALRSQCVSEAPLFASGTLALDDAALSKEEEEEEEKAGEDV